VHCASTVNREKVEETDNDSKKQQRRRRNSQEEHRSRSTQGVEGDRRNKKKTYPDLNRERENDEDFVFSLVSSVEPDLVR
jgi:hypothetical protein